MADDILDGDLAAADRDGAALIEAREIFAVLAVEQNHRFVGLQWASAIVVNSLCVRSDEDVVI